MTPVLPILPADLLRFVSETWPQVVRTSERYPGQLAEVIVQCCADGTVVAVWRPEDDAEVRRALSALADVLEGERYLVVDRTAGLRVVGRAAVPSEWRDDRSKIRKYRGGYLIALADLHPADPRRIAWDDRCMKERAARLPPMPVERAERLRRFGR